MFKKTALLILLVVVLTSASFAQQTFPVTTVYRGTSTINSAFVTGLNSPNYDIHAELDVEATGLCLALGMINHGSQSSCSLVVNTSDGGYSQDVFNNVSFSTTTVEVKFTDVYGNADPDSYYRVGEAEEHNGDD